ncbi:hypothetical protein IRJ41_025349 [Triplophysa rosa]|uniref:Uncharacterized protein n=1 Tax=Triplophysa rosa TaxID=992332 RepID=A0A9W7WDF7_TRIRA|nr:hypothetical protein IRJ41_025349 [Triplophysa rosa]
MKNPVFWVVLTGIGIALIQQGTAALAEPLCPLKISILSASPAWDGPPPRPLAGSSCTDCERLSLAVLRTPIAFFSGPAPCAPPPVPLQQRRRKHRTHEPECERADEPTPSPPQRSDPECLTYEDLRLSSSASGMVSFSGTDELDKVLSPTSECDDWAALDEEAAPPVEESSDARPHSDSKLVRVLSKVVAELSIDWSSPIEPEHSCLDEWFLEPGCLLQPGCLQQPPRQRAAPFFPEVQQEFTRSWRAPHSARFHSSFTHTLSSIDGADDKGYTKLPTLEECVAAHLCQSSASGWKARPSHPQTQFTFGTRLADRLHFCHSIPGILEWIINVIKTATLFSSFAGLPGSGAYYTRRSPMMVHTSSEPKYKPC